MPSLHLRTRVLLALLAVAPLVLTACGKGKGGGY
jgi:predicted small secreted protein